MAGGGGGGGSAENRGIPAGPGGAGGISGAHGSTVLYLRGELGAGKSTCVRSLLRALGVEGLIRSPTYTLVEAYQPRGFSCIHVDLYRLQGPVDVEELGLRDFLDTDCLLLVEWPEKGGPALPPADIDLTLTYAYPDGGGMAWGAGPEDGATIVDDSEGAANVGSWEGAPIVGSSKGASAMGNPDGAACRRARLEGCTARGRRWLNMLLHDTSLTPYLSNST